MKQQTGLEWLVKEANLLENNGWLRSLIQIANAIDKQNIIDAWEDGNDNDHKEIALDFSNKYYNKTFKEI